MKLKLDENLPELVREELHSQGLDVETASSENLSGATDTAILAACVSEGRVLVTLDLDFADIRIYRAGTHFGIWVLRPAKQTFAAILKLVQAGVRLTAVERTVGQLWVIDETRVRIRDGEA